MKRIEIKGIVTEREFIERYSKLTWEQVLQGDSISMYDICYPCCQQYKTEYDPVMGTWKVINERVPDIISSRFIEIEQVDERYREYRTEDGKVWYNVIMRQIMPDRISVELAGYNVPVNMISDDRVLTLNII